MKALVINLDRSVERWKTLKPSLSSLGMQVDRVSAIDGRQLRDAEIEAIVVAGRTPSRGEIGCFLSHRKTWETIVAQQLGPTLILEDDAIPIGGASRSIHGMLESADPMPDCDVLRVEGIPRKHIWIDPKSVLSWRGMDVAVQMESQYGSAAYVTDAHGAARMLEAFPRYDVPVDLALYCSGLVDVRVACKSMFVQRRFLGDEDHGTIDDRGYPETTSLQRLMTKGARQIRRLRLALKGHRRVRNM